MAAFTTDKKSEYNFHFSLVFFLITDAYMRQDVVTAVKSSILVIWLVTPCRLLIRQLTNVPEEHTVLPTDQKMEAV